MKFAHYQNQYDLSGDFGIGYTRKGEPFWFDLSDYDRIKDICWHYGANGYLYGYIPKTRKIVLFHRYIFDKIPKKKCVDHIVHPRHPEQKYDNRRSNLRVCSRAQNMHNHAKFSHNTSGVEGVLWDKSINMWRVNIWVNNKKIYLGASKNFDEAVKIRKRGEEKYFGSYAYEANNKD